MFEMFVTVSDPHFHIFPVYTRLTHTLYRPSIFFMGQRQIVQTQIRRHRTRRPIWDSTVCLQNVLKIWIKMKFTAQHPLNGKLACPFAKGTVGESIQIKCFFFLFQNCDKQKQRKNRHSINLLSRMYERQLIAGLHSILQGLSFSC